MKTPAICALFFTLLTGGAANPLQQEIDLAIARGEKQIRLKQRQYRCDSRLELKKLDGVTIDGNGAELIRTTLSAGGILISGCRGLTLKNLTLDFDPLPFTQGRITRIQGNQVHFQIDRGYPRLTPPYAVRQINFFEADGVRWKRLRNGDVYGPTHIVSSDSGYCVFARVPEELERGDRIILNIRSSFGIMIERSGGTTLSDLRIWSAPGVAVLGRFNLGGDLFRRIVIERGPAPSEQAAPRLISTSADGLNYAFSRPGIRLEQCDFSYMGDDSVNFHSVALPIAYRKNGRTLDVLRQFGRESFPETVCAGDRVRLLSAGTYEVKAEAKIAGFKLSPRNYRIADVNRFYQRNWNRAAGKFTAYEVTLDRDLEFSDGDFLDLPGLAVSDFTIRDNYFHDHRARGLRIMSSDGVIENNRIERTKSAAISVGCEYGYWREAGWVKNIIIRNNRLKQIGRGSMTTPDSYTPGAISVFAKLEDYSGSCRGNRNILIEKNSINGSEGAGIFVFRGDGITIRGNQLEKVLQDKRGDGNAFPFGTPDDIWVADSAVTLQ